MKNLTTLILISCFWQTGHPRHYIGSVGHDVPSVTRFGTWIETRVDGEPQIGEIHIFAWWWKRADAVAGIDTEKPPQKEYREIEKWEYDGDGITTSPDRIDLRFPIIADPAFTGTVVFSMAPGFDVLDKAGRRERLEWIGRREIYRQDFRGTEDVMVPDVDLAGPIDARSRGRGPTAVRFTIMLNDAAGHQIARRDRIIEVVLGD